MNLLKKRKLVLILLILLIILLVIGLFSVIITKRNSYEHENVLRAEIISESKTNTTVYKELNSITIPTFEKKISDKRDFLVYIGRPTCSDCNLFDPILVNELKKEDMTSNVVFLNVAWERQKGWTSWVQFKKKYGFKQTPAIIHYHNGKVLSIIQWGNNKGISKGDLHLWLIKQKEKI